jgi:hypothetical protein
MRQASFFPLSFDSILNAAFCPQFYDTTGYKSRSCFWGNQTYDHKNETSAQEKMKFSKHFLYARQICAPNVPAMYMICFEMCKDRKNVTA